VQLKRWQVKTSNRFALLNNVDDNVEIKQENPWFDKECSKLRVVMYNVRRGTIRQLRNKEMEHLKYKIKLMYLNQTVWKNIRNLHRGKMNLPRVSSLE
jgi:hypothetical protein